MRRERSVSIEQLIAETSSSDRQQGVDDYQATTFPEQPLRLALEGKLPESWIDDWLMVAPDIVPDHLSVQGLFEASDEGEPDLLFEQICAACGTSWQGEFAAWLAMS